MRTTNSNSSLLKTSPNRAISLNRRGKHRAAIKVLLPLLRSHPRSAAISGYLAGAYFELGEFGRASTLFRRAVTLTPKSELASLGLFHSLWNQQSRAEAFAEMRRFVSEYDSGEYARLLRDMAVEGELEPRNVATAGI